MAMPLLISSSSNNQKQLGFAISSNNYRNRSLSLFPSFINGGAESVMNNGVSSNYSNQLHSNKFLSVAPSFNGSDHQVINGVSLNYSNQTNRSLSVVPSLNGGDQQVINGVSLNYSNSIYRGLTLVPSFNDYERVMNNGISSSYSSNQQELGFSVSSSNHRNRCLPLVPSFNNYEPVMNTGVPPSSSNQQKLGFSVSRSNLINKSLSLVPSFNDYEPVMNNGISHNYSDRLELGFPVLTRNHQNRSLSLVPSFKIRGESVNMIERRRSIVRNYRFSYSARLLATREILRARLIAAFSTRRRMVPSFSSQINLSNSQQSRARITITELDEEAFSDGNQARSNYNGALLLAPTPVSVCYPSATNNDQNDVENDDGITHSLPCKKYGPYTCPRCFGKFPTSQAFAAHVSSHYKYETKAQRRRRLMAKIRRRNLRLHHSREGLTLLPTKPVAQSEPTNMAEAEAQGDGVVSKVQIKEEPADF